MKRVVISFSKAFLFFAIAIVVAFASCRDKNIYPLEPVISFKSFNKVPNSLGVDQEGILTLTFTDGDGDIGLTEEDTLSPFQYGGEYYYNFYIDFYEKQNDSFVKIDLPSEFHARIPLVEADLASKGYKGDLEIKLFINNPNSSYDTIMFETYIYDRALNKSNVVRTPDIVVKKSK